MKKSQFKEKFGIADIRPVSVAHHHVFATEFADATKRFIDDNFRGICEISCNVPDNSAVLTISMEQSVCFFRDLLAAVYGGEMIHIKIDIDEINLNVCIEAEEHLPIECKDANALIRRSKQAGFEVEITNTCLKAYTKHKRFAYCKVYALSFDQLYGLYRLMFFGPKDQK